MLFVEALAGEERGALVFLLVVLWVVWTWLLFRDSGSSGVSEASVPSGKEDGDGGEPASG